SVVPASACWRIERFPVKSDGSTWRTRIRALACASAASWTLTVRPRNHLSVAVPAGGAVAGGSGIGAGVPVVGPGGKTSIVRRTAVNPTLEGGVAIGMDPPDTMTRVSV